MIYFLLWVKNYYRLKSLDHDFTFEYSDVILVNFSGDKNLVVFPNPLQDNTLKFRTNFLSLSGDKAEIFDNLGLKIIIMLIIYPDFAVVRAGYESNTLIECRTPRQ